MYVCVFIWRGEKIMGLCVYGAGRSGMRSSLKNSRREQFNLWPLCTELNQRSQSQILERKNTENTGRIKQTTKHKLNIPKGKSWTTASLLTPFSLVIDLHSYRINQPFCLCSHTTEWVYFLRLCTQWYNMIVTHQAVSSAVTGFAAVISSVVSDWSFFITCHPHCHSLH